MITLEPKEVDVEKEARHYLLHEHLSPLNNILHQADLKTELQYHKDIETAFKAGFGLGLKVNNDTVIEKACDWLKTNVTYTHPRTDETKCVVNLNAFVNAMKGE